MKLLADHRQTLLDHKFTVKDINKGRDEVWTAPNGRRISSGRAKVMAMEFQQRQRERDAS